MANLLDKYSKVAVTSRSFSKNKELVSFLKSKFQNVKLNTQGFSLKGKSLINFLDGMDAAIIGLEPITKQVVSKLPSLKVISKYGVGTNNLDMEAIKKSNISIALSPGSNAQSVAEYTLYLILLSLRQNFNNLEEISRNIWSKKKLESLDTEILERSLQQF
jgi:D-3-phosphoglycerate dehydrogenase